MIDTTALNAMRSSRILEPYINHIRFPHFKNLAAGTRIDFDFPITALVGPNGANKSSVLKALFGAPGQNNLGTRWFSTSVDPIVDSGGRPRFIYGFWNPRTQEIVEVIKTRIQRADNPDYWEPSRPLSSDGMIYPPKLSTGTKFPDRSGTRWNPISKKVVYIDFRSELSSFDQYFYFGGLRKTARTKNKQDFIRSRSHYLRRAIDEDLGTLMLWTKERLFGNSLLSPAQLGAASKILGVDYSTIRVIEHSLFGHVGYSAVLSSPSLQYSEAFAGSGEFAVLMLVKKISEAEDRSLILLDEPEVSLHPGAQERLISYLSSMVKTHRHQIIMSTHSPTMVRDLPASAIKVFQREPPLSQFSVLPRATPAEAFFHLGEPQPNKLRILVEDRLGKEIIKAAIRQDSPAFRNQVQIEIHPGGAESLIKYYARVFVMESRKDTLIFLDGDKQTASMHDPDLVPASADATLGDLIQQATGIDLPVIVDGGENGGNAAQKFEFQRNFMKWYRQYVRFLPTQSPEEFVWTHTANSEDMNGFATGNYKHRFRDLVRLRLGLAPDEPVDSGDILSVERQALANISQQDTEMMSIRSTVTHYVEAFSVS
jgi:hypothetical protein